MKLRLREVAAACVLALLPTSAIPAAAEPLSTDPPVKIEQATSSYFITSYGDPNDHSPEPWQILSIADGSVVRTSPRPRENPFKAPTLLGKYILDIAPGMATFRDIGTGVVSQVDVPAGATFQGAYPSGILLSRTADGGSSFTHNLDVVSYDVAYRTTPAGQAFGAWVYPAGWQGIRSTSVDWAPVLGSDRCFMSRARDAMGNTSAWSPATCSANPQDDRALTATGSVTRTTSPLAFRTSTSQLRASGASLSKSGESGIRIALVTINGPGQGSVDVYHAGIKIARVSLVSSTWTRKVTYLPITPYRTGAVTITSVCALPSLIDGVAFLRA